MMVPSWMLVWAPMRIALLSPRNTQPYQIDEPAPISTSPMTTAVSAMKASGAIRGSRPPKALIKPDMLASLTGQSQHQLDVLDGGTGGAFAQIVEPRHQHRLTLRLIGIDTQFQLVGIVERFGLQFAIGGRLQHLDQIGAVIVTRQDLLQVAAAGLA